MQITFDPRWAPPSMANGRLTNLCPGATAVLRCGTSPDSGTCGGDSGGGVVTSDNPPRLIAVDSVGDRPCGPRRANGFTEITAPEIRSWLAGNPTPVFAPRVSAPFSHCAPARHRAVPSRHLVGDSVFDVHVPGRDHDRGPPSPT